MGAGPKHSEQHTENRRAAFVGKLKRFTGDECQNCGSFEYYAVNNCCTFCTDYRRTLRRQAGLDKDPETSYTHRSEKDREARRRAVKLGDVRYKGDDCPVHGSTERYAEGGKCCDCVIERAQKYKAEHSK